MAERVNWMWARIRRLKTALLSASVLTLIGTALRIGGGIITLPLALKNISSEELGLYYTMVGLTGLAGLLDFGFGAAVTRNAGYAMGGAKQFSPRGVPLNNTQAGPNWKLLDELRIVVHRWSLSLGSTVCVLLLIAGTPFIQSQIAIAKLPGALNLCWVALVLAVCFNVATNYWSTLLNGAGFVREAALAGVLTQLAAISVLIVSLIGGLGVWSYAVSLWTSSLFGLLLPWRMYYKTIPETNSSRNRLEIIPILKTLWPMVWRQGLVLLGAFLIQRGNTIVCSSRLGLEETASYGLSVTLIVIIFQVSTVPLQLVFPAISRLRVEGNITAIRRLFFSRLYLGLICAATGVIVLAWFGNSLLHMIGSNTPLLPPVSFIILGVVWGLEAHHWQYAMLVLSENENPFVWPVLVSGLFVFALSWYAAGEWGILGLVLAQGAVQLAWNNWWIVYRGLAGVSRKS